MYTPSILIDRFSSSMVVVVAAIGILLRRGFGFGAEGSCDP